MQDFMTRLFGRQGDRLLFELIFLSPKGNKFVLKSTYHKLKPLNQWFLDLTLRHPEKTESIL